MARIVKSSKAATPKVAGHPARQTERGTKKALTAASVRKPVSGGPDRQDSKGRPGSKHHDERPGNSGTSPHTRSPLGRPSTPTSVGARRPRRRLPWINPDVSV